MKKTYTQSEILIKILKGLVRFIKFDRSKNIKKLRR